MNLDQLSIFVERLRKETIGEPLRVQEKGVYEYQDHSAQVVAILKLVRAAQGVHALRVLCHNGLFVDFGAIFRCVFDYNEEIYFLLEEFPEHSGIVDQFVKAFFETTIDGFLSAETAPMPRKKVRSAMVRVLKGRHDHHTNTLSDNVFTTFYGYIHSNYSHIMEMYNGALLDFNLAGVPSITERQERMGALADLLQCEFSSY